MYGGAAGRGGGLREDQACLKQPPKELAVATTKTAKKRKNNASSAEAGSNKSNPKSEASQAKRRKPSSKKSSPTTPEVFMNNWLDDPSKLPLAKFHYGKPTQQITREIHLGTNYFNRWTREWCVVHTEYQEGYLEEEHNRRGPNAWREYTKIGDKKEKTKELPGKRNRRPRAGFERHRNYEQSGDRHITNQFPSIPSQLPDMLTNWPGGFVAPPALQLPPLIQALGCRNWSRFYGQVCSDHPTGCGLDLTEGDLVVVDGRDTVRVHGMTYWVGVFKVGESLRRKCKVGVVQTLSQHLQEVTNQYAQVTYVCPESGNNTDSPKKQPFSKMVEGYFHLSFLNTGTGELPTKEMVALHKSKKAVGKEVEELHPCNVYHCFDPLLPTAEDFEKKRASNKVGRKKRGVTKKKEDDEEGEQDEGEADEDEEEARSSSSESDE